MTYHHGWLALVDDNNDVAQEIINHARTAKYLQTSTALGCRYVSDVLDDGGCAGYRYQPQCGLPVVDLPGTTTNYISTPDTAALDITGDLTLVAHVAADDWTPAATQSLVIKWSGTGNQRSYGLQLTTAGALAFVYTVDGSTVVQRTSTANLAALANGSWKWVACTVDVVDTTNHSVRFWTSDDGVTWVQLGTTVTTAGTIALFSGTAPLTVGAHDAGASAPFAGLVRRVQVRSGIGALGAVGGTIVAEYIANGISSYTDTTGKLWTVNGTGVTYALNTTISAGSTTWSQITPTTPSGALNPAPWYNAAYPESAKALGFWITEWTGLDSGHVVRATTPLGSLRGGAQLGRLGAQGRTMAFNVILLGESEKALEYLFRWLEAALMSVCATCTTNRIWIRRFCPENTDPVDAGVAELREVGLVEGLKWLAPLSENSGCYIRPASFTLMAGDPCMYGLETAAGQPGVLTSNMNTCFTGAAARSTNRPDCRPTCSELSASSSCRTIWTVDVTSIGAEAPYLVLSNTDNSLYTVPVRIATYVDPALIGTAGLCGLPLIGELYVRSLPPNSELIYDAIGRRVLYRDPSTGSYINGWAYVDVNSVGVPRWPAMGCTRHHVVMEPGSLCFDGTSGAWTDASGINYGADILPTGTLYLQERFGCP